MFKVIIAGSRHFYDYSVLCRFCDKVLKNKVLEGEEIEIVSGRCYGVDLLGERYASERKFKIKAFPADWSVYGQGAGIIRNEQMAKYADALIAIWDGSSRGTANMIANAAAENLLIRVLRYEK